MHRSQTNAVSTFLTVGLVAGLAGPAPAAVPMRIVVTTAEQAPGVPNGVVFEKLGRPDINSNGIVAFAGELAGIGVTADNDKALWSEQYGPLTMIAREGAQAPGLPLMTWFKSFGTPILNDNDRLAFEASVKGAGVTFSNDEAIWAQVTSGFGLVAREGNTAAGLAASIKHNGIYPPCFNDDGRVTFGGALTGPTVDFTNNAAVWSGFPGAMSLVVREANQAPDLPTGIIYKYGSTDIGAVLGGSNTVAYRAGLDGSVNPDNDNAIYSGTTSTPQLLVREGEQAPGAPAGVNIGNVLQPTINEVGRTAFLTLLGGTADNTNNTAILSEGSGQLDMVARKGDQAPTLPNGVVFEHLQLPLFNANGHTAFSSLLVGTNIDESNDECLWSETTGNLAPFAFEGERAPDTPEGVVFAGDAANMIPAFTGQMAMNDLGQILFAARVDGPGIVDTNRNGIWMFDPNVGTRLIIMTGDVIEMGPGDTRVVSNLIFQSGSGGSDGLPSSLGDSGKAAIWTWFTDGSEAILVTDDTDGDGTIDPFDNCPATVNAGQEDSDGDGTGDECDGCPNDGDKFEAGVCGCGVSDEDTDGDGTPDCFDECPDDANKIAAGICGCGQPDLDDDGDGILNCDDNCPDDPNPTQDNVCNAPPPQSATGTDDLTNQDCCGGGAPMMMPFMLMGWRSFRRRRVRR